jgi:hypothetical protein
MNNEIAFLLAVGITLLLSGLVVFYLRGPLQRVLRDLCGTDDRAAFWTSFANVFLFVMPLAAVLLGRNLGQAPDTLFFAVVEQAKWALLGLILALFLTAVGVAAFVWPRLELPLTRSEVDELHRLIEKIEQIRAQEILSRASAGVQEESPRS